MVIHGGVDGFTRIPLFLHCSTKSKATTVLGLFLNAIENYGLPSRVRSDKGKENVDVAWYMLNYPLRGPGRGSKICGRSVHNQRIQALSRDFQRAWIKGIMLIYSIFKKPKDQCFHIALTNFLKCL